MKAYIFTVSGSENKVQDTSGFWYFFHEWLEHFYRHPCLCSGYRWNTPKSLKSSHAVNKQPVHHSSSVIRRHIIFKKTRQLGAERMWVTGSFSAERCNRSFSSCVNRIDCRQNSQKIIQASGLRHLAGSPGYALWHEHLLLRLQQGNSWKIICLRWTKAGTGVFFMFFFFHFHTLHIQVDGV